MWMDLLNGGPAPKRGDLLHTNVGDRRERTWMILRARRMRRAGPVPRYELWAARWWEIEPETRIRLYESATRNGGQHLHLFHRYPRPQKQRGPRFGAFDF